MSVMEDLIDFDIIETQKENIQSLPSGRSAKALASIFSASPINGFSEPTLNDTKTLNDAIRNEYEIELRSIAESDDPLDIFDRYVKWTLNAYPSAQATPQSQLLPLLERATKSFVSTAHYKNDPRYLKLWLHYIRFFSDTPRETFAFLARHNIGDGLALFYEEFAAWLESAGRWTQAEEVYKMGIDREARPQERLVRKFGEFRNRSEQRPQTVDEPSSPALPSVRPALAAKLDPWATSAPRSSDPQAPLPATAGAITRPGRQKLAIFSDADSTAAGSQPSISKGWDNIGSLQERKKENTVEAKPWAGETLKVGSRAGTVPKMQVFRDGRSSDAQPQILEPRARIAKAHPSQEAVNPKTKKVERVFVDLESVYPDVNDPSREMSFEELRAAHRGWLNKGWCRPKDKALQETSMNVQRPGPIETVSAQDGRDSELSKQLQENLTLDNASSQQDIGARHEKEESREGRNGRPKKLRVREVKQETQTVKANLDSPTATGRKLRRKNSSEPTMTMHTKAATDEIYDIFNQPMKSELQDNTESGCESDYEDDECTSAGESTGTGKISTTTSEFGEDDTSAVKRPEDGTISVSLSEWSDFTSSKHVPRMDGEGEDEENGTAAASLSRKISGTTFELTHNPKHVSLDDVLVTSSVKTDSGQNPVKTTFIPLPPEDFEQPRRTYRTEAELAQNRLPFMTPIMEKTESSVAPTDQRDYFNSKTPSASSAKETPALEVTDDEDITFVEQQKLKTMKSATPIKSKNPSQRNTMHSKAKIVAAGDPLSSPFQQTLSTESPLAKSVARKASFGSESSPAKKFKAAYDAMSYPVRHGLNSGLQKVQATKDPIIKDSVCNPVHDDIRLTILQNIQPSLAEYKGYHDYSDKKNGQRAEIEKYSNAVGKMKKSTSDKTGTISIPPILQFGGAEHVYAIKRCLGKGGYGAVYLVEIVASDDLSSSDTDKEQGESVTRKGRGKFELHPRTKNLEAIKMEDDPSAWEFYIIGTVHRRLGISRAADSIVRAYEMHVFRDESFLVEEFREQGTLFDLINVFRDDASKGLAPTGAMEEILAMFFSIELFRTVEVVHAKGIIHGDLKTDNCLLRFDPIPREVNNGDLSSTYSSDGSNGWSYKGVSLIDFGRGIDTKSFIPNVGFIADWKTNPEDCPEMHEARPWTYQIDYYGLANIIHQMLFNKDLATVAEKSTESTSMGIGAQAQKWYKLREPLKRYQQGEVWSSVFDVLLNPLRPDRLKNEDGRSLPVTKGMKTVREDMEAWVEREAERKGLRALVLKLENRVKERASKAK